MNRVFPACCSRSRSDAAAVNAQPGYKRRGLTGKAKVDVKAQSHPKLYNRAEESTWQGGQGGETNRVWRRKKKWKKRQAFVSVYPPHCTYNRLHMNCWRIGKMKYWQLRWWFFLRAYYSSLERENHRHAKMLYGTINDSRWALQRCHALCCSHHPRRRQCATTAMKPSYLRHSTGNNLKQLLLFFPVCTPTSPPPSTLPAPDCSLSRRHNASS